MFQITFPQFKQSLERVISIAAITDRLNEAARGTDLVLSFPTLECEVVGLLEIMTNCTEDEWISYWCWELDFGKNWKPGTITDLENNDVPLGTIEDLWNLLVDDELKRGKDEDT